MPLGPGTVYVLSILGTGDMVSNMTAGASYGYHLIWALGMTLVFRFVWVNTSAKYVLVTGESLLQGYGKVAKWIPWLVLVASFPIQYFTNQFLILMMGNSAHLLFPLPIQWSSALWSILFTLVGFSMMFWGGYLVIESFCKILIGIMGGSLLIAALLSRPDPAAIITGMFFPHLPHSHGLYSTTLIIMALIGTEVGSTANLTYSYFIQEKGWKGVSYLKQQRLDLTIGVICLFLMGALLQISAAGTIHPLGIDVKNAEDLGRIFSETQGKIGLVVFSLGLWGAAFSTFVGVNTGCALIVLDICRKFVPGFNKHKFHTQGKQLAQLDPIYRGTILLWSFSPLYVIFTDVNPVWLVLVVSSFVAFLIPILVLALVKMTNDRTLMGKHKNNYWVNGILTTLALVTTYFAYKNGLFWLSEG